MHSPCPHQKLWLQALALALLSAFGSACQPDSPAAESLTPAEPLAQNTRKAEGESPVPPLPPPKAQRGLVVIDGSSTVFPITEAVAREFEAQFQGALVQLGVSGTGGGFRKFCAGETAISDASRPIKSEEAEACAKAGISFIELPVGFDGLTFVVHRNNTWAACMTVDELRRLWQPAAEGKILRWSDLRPGWPQRQIQLYGPGRDSGTFDYMTSALVGQEGSARHDFVGSEDDYLLAQNVAAEKDALGFFGFAYYREYQDTLRAVAIDAGAGCVMPDEQSINLGSYRPLSRPVFIYVSLAALEQEEVRNFTRFYLEVAPRLVAAVKYVPLPARAYALAQTRLSRRITGSLFSGGSQVGISIEELLDMESSGLVRKP